MRMQPGVTVVLATVWLYANVVGTASLNSSRFSLDQYSPLAPQHELYQRVPIGSRRSSSTSTASPLQSFKTNYLDKDSLHSKSKGNSGGDDDDFSPLVEDKQRRKKFTEQKIDGGGTKDSEQPSLALSELEDPFIADDTFQDQGPGSMEIYKLDLLRLYPLNHVPLTRYLLKGKGKTPKKTSQADWKAKTTDYKSTSPKMFYKQSNSFDDLSTEVPPNSDPFSIGGVPELQVGCEGLAATKYKQKRSIDSGGRDKAPIAAMDTWPGVTPISLDMYDFSSVEEEEDEMDELVRLKKLETTTKGIKQNRGDMEATRYSDSDDKGRPEKLPVRGDLGKSNGQNSTGGDQKTAGEGSNSDIAKREAFEEEEAKSADSLVPAHQRRRILWLDDSVADEQLRTEGRSKRQIWGFGEDEGVVSSDELQTENQRRRQDYERRRKEEERRRLEEARRRGHVENRTNSEVERIKQEYERSLQERTRQEEERQRRLQQEARRTSSRWQSPEEHRERPQELVASPRRYESYPHTSTYDEERRHQEAEAMRRRDWEAERRRQQELDRRHLEQRRREWMLKRRQEEEDERRRQQARNEPSNLLYAMRAASNESGPYYVDPERRFREQQEREREEKLKEYMQRNRPINPADRQREEEIRRKQDEERRRIEEERKLQEYIRRNQPVHVTSGNGSSVDQRKKMDDWSRAYNWSRYPGQGNGRRNHGPSAPTNIDPRSFVEERRRKEASRRTEEDRIRERERLEEEQLRKEALRREEEARRLQSRRYEEQRKRLEAARRDADRRRKELMEEQARRSQAGRTRSENTRHGYDDRARLEELRRRQDTSLIPANLVLNESRRTMEQDRQRQEQDRQRYEQERWRLEAERRRQEDSRAKQGREHEQRRRQEEARLNALPVSARIIVHPAQSSSSPRLSSRTGFDGDIDFPGVNPYRRGVEVPNFPAAATRRPPVQSPPACVWAVVQCCPFNTNRLVTCFESMGCPGVNWDPNPCRGSITKAARQQITKFYAESEEENRGL
nr:trichohyalin-like isoform X2 [Osmia lignaria]